MFCSESLKIDISIDRCVCVCIYMSNNNKIDEVKLVKK